MAATFQRALSDSSFSRSAQFPEIEGRPISSRDGLAASPRTDYDWNIYPDPEHGSGTACLKGEFVMALTSSTMLELGTKAVDFSLPDVVSGKTIRLETFFDMKALLVIFLSRHCPYVQHVREELAKLGRDYSRQSVGIVAISANDVINFPDDRPESLKEMAVELGLNYPICYDESQTTARAYTAACTPDFFLFDQNRKLVYRGQLDDSRPGNNIPVTGKDLRAALDAVLAGSQVPTVQKPSLGCNIKWKVGQEPAYARGTASS
jgi:peroxiredoxin